jgi:galactose mutarotase-like enzyme
MLYEIKNEHLTVKIKSFGAELSSVKDYQDTEYIWQGDKKYWGRQAPLLFPVIGRLPGETTYFDSVSYNIPLHGFIRDYEFNPVVITEESITFECNSNHEMLERFPFEFEFSTTYTLIEKSLIQTFSVKNCSDKKMYFALGGHTGFNCPMVDGERFEDYTIEFIKCDRLRESQIDKIEKGRISKAESFNLDYHTFSDGVLTFENTETKGLKLINRNTGRGIRIDYEEFDFLGIWTRETINSPFICIEPWIGMLKKNTDKIIEFKDNIAIACVSPEENFIKSYGVTII